MKINLMIGALWVLSSLAHAGGGDVGNGGYAHVCLDSDGKIVSAELADFYEAREGKEKLTILKNNSLSLRTQIENALDKLTVNPTSLSRVQKEIESVMSRSFYVIKADLDQLPTDDATFRVSPQPNCYYTNVGRYFDGSKILHIRNEIIEHFSQTDIAGLYVHEGAYRVSRIKKYSKKSDSVRSLVAYAFSTQIKDENKVSEDFNNAVMHYMPTCGAPANLTIDQRIAHCQQQLGESVTTKVVDGSHLWKLVVQLGIESTSVQRMDTSEDWLGRSAYRVWRDESTGKIWSDLMPRNNFEAANSYCRNGSGFSQIDEALGYLHLASKVKFRLPSVSEIQDANRHGLFEVTSSHWHKQIDLTKKQFWTRSFMHFLSGSKKVFSKEDGEIYEVSSKKGYHYVQCIATP